MEISVREQAKKTVFGVSDTQASAAATGGASSEFLNKLGTGQSDPQIRESLDSEMKALDKADQPTAERLLFWKEKEPQGKTIDPVEEQKRLEAEGVTKPAATPGSSSPAPASATVEKRNEDILENSGQ
jgi:hypothetical protein